MAKSNTSKIVFISVGIVIIVVGSIFYFRKLRFQKEKNKCLANGDIWNEKTKKCDENPLKKLLAKSITDLNFKSGSKEITTNSYPFLNELAKSLLDYPTLTLTITGHTDSDGSDEFNQTLSVNRANSVKNYLITKLIDEKRLVAIGKGESEPIDTTNTASGKEKNRRVVMTLSQSIV